MPEPPHALLFVGAEGTGRTRLALEYALLLNCERREAPAGPTGPAMFDELPAEPQPIPCYTCRTCRLMLGGGHPDLVHLGPGDVLCRPRAGDSAHPSHQDSRDIRICQVRGLVDLAGRFPLEARYRAVIIEPAERLGRDSAHALLKTLEEPPGHTVMLLVTAAPEAIIETVRSRCRLMDVPLVARDEIEQGLKRRGVEEAIAARAALEARGRPARAITFSHQPDLMDDRVRFLKRCATVAASGVAERMNYAKDLADRWRKDRRAVGVEIDAWESFWESRLRLAAHEGAAAEDAASVVEALEAVVTARQDLLAQVQARLALDLMLLHFPRTTLEDQPEEELAPANV